MTVHQLFPDEYRFTSRKITAANNTTPRTEVPPAAMQEWAEEHDFPNVNSRYDTTEDDAKALVQVAVLAMVGLVVALPLCIALATALGVRL